MNSRNQVSLLGRLASDPKIFNNTDGSKKIRFTLMVNNPYNKDKADGIPVERFVQKDSQLGVYALIHKGDLVKVDAHIVSNVYQDKTTGEDVYKTVIAVDNVDMLESKSVTDARLAARVAGGETPTGAVTAE